MAVSTAADNDSSVVFSHLFSAPLIERKRNGEAEKVDELSYQGERETLLRTLGQAGKRVRFVSEAANTDSFRRAVGCPSGQSGRGALGARSSVAGSPTPAFSGAVGRDLHSFLGRSCRDGSCRIVHFTGHGVVGSLTFEDRHGQLQYVDEEALMNMLLCQGRGEFPLPEPAAPPAATSEQLSRSRPTCPDILRSGSPSRETRVEREEDGRLRERTRTACRNGLQLVFLSSCHSASVAECFIQAGVSHVIAVRKDCKVLDHKAADFAESFYASLLRGDTVRQAFNLGSARMGASDDPREGHRFLLLPLDGNHDVPVFDEVPAGAFTDDTPPQPDYSCDSITDHFLGRAVEVQKVVKHLVDGARCVTIMGQKGIGKTQVLLKACAYTTERHVFGDIFFCRVDKAVDATGRGHDACNWLEKGFRLRPGSLGARNMDGAVAKITDHVVRNLAKLRRKGSRTSLRVLLVLDGCEGHLMVGQERVKLRDLLSLLLQNLPALTVAVTMRAATPGQPGIVGIGGEHMVVVDRLDDRSTARLFLMCCSYKLAVKEMDPYNEATIVNGQPDTLGAFARGDIVRALEGHPACVLDLCRRVHEENSLRVRKQSLLEKDIPEIRAQYAYDQPARPTSGNRRRTERNPVPARRTSDALSRFWSEVSGAHSRVYGGDEAEVSWGRLCEGMAQYFADQVSGARERPLRRSDLDIFAKDDNLWDGPSPSQMAEAQHRDVATVTISRQKFKPLWRWFYKAIETLELTRAWSLDSHTRTKRFIGFMRRPVADSLLASSPPGTFLIRFSTSHAGALAVQYTKGGRVINVVVNVKAPGQLTCDVRRGEPRTFSSLDDLALSMRMLVYLYPDTPKSEVFSRPTHRHSLPAQQQEQQQRHRHQHQRHHEHQQRRGERTSYRGGHGRESERLSALARRWSLAPAIPS